MLLIARSPAWPAARPGVGAKGIGSGFGLVRARSRSGTKPLGSLAFYSFRSLDRGLRAALGFTIGFSFPKKDGVSLVRRRWAAGKRPRTTAASPGSSWCAVRGGWTSLPLRVRAVWVPFCPPCGGDGGIPASTGPAPRSGFTGHAFIKIKPLRLQEVQQGAPCTSFCVLTIPSTARLIEFCPKIFDRRPCFPCPRAGHSQADASFIRVKNPKGT